MSSSEFGREVPEINEKSTIPELIGLLLSSFERKDFKLVEEILVRREVELSTQLTKEREEHLSLAKIHGESELEKLEIQDDLKRLKNENLELQEELKNRKKEKLQTAQKFLGYEERMTNLEKAVANMFSMDVSEIQKFVCNSLENDLQEEGNSNLDCKQTPENAPNQRESPQASYGCNDRTLEIKKGLLNDHGNAQSVMEDSCDTPKVEIDGLNQENENDSSYAAAPISISRICDRELHDKELLVLEKSTEVVPSSNQVSDRPQSPIIVEIIESDDEAPGDEKPRVSNTCSSVANSGKKGATFMESGTRECPTQTEDENKKNMSDPLEDLLPKRKRGLTEFDDSGTSSVSKQKTKPVRELLNDGKDSIVSNCSVKSTATGSHSILSYPQSQLVNKRCKEEAQTDCSLQTASRKLDFHCSADSSDYSSSDSEDECSESFINQMIESLRQDCRKSQKTWTSASDMKLEFLNDNELCMNAVCALYRKEISAGKAINYTSRPVNPGFYLFDAKSLKDLAEFLIDGDPQYKLKRTVSEAQQKDSRLLDRCKELAVQHYKTLFEIYRKNEDPFFPPRS